MNHYTMSEVKKLALVIHSFYSQESDVWSESLKNLFAENKALPYRAMIKKTLLEISGFCFSVYDGSCNYKSLTDLLFNMPLNNMPLYISSPEKRERLIAQWRLTISR